MHQGSVQKDEDWSYLSDIIVGDGLSESNLSHIFYELMQINGIKKIK